MEKCLEIAVVQTAEGTFVEFTLPCSDVIRIHVDDVRRAEQLAEVVTSGFHSVRAVRA